MRKVLGRRNVWDKQCDQNALYRPIPQQLVQIFCKYIKCFLSRYFSLFIVISNELNIRKSIYQTLANFLFQQYWDRSNTKPRICNVVLKQHNVIVREDRHRFPSSKNNKRLAISHRCPSRPRYVLKRVLHVWFL